MKYVREARMGTAFSFKTGAVVGTYPKPMIVALFDEGGLDIIPSKAVLDANNTNKDLVKMDVSYEDIVFADPSELATWAAKPTQDQPKVLAFSFVDKSNGKVALEFKNQGDSVQFTKFFHWSNQLYGKASLPWRTMVLDSLTGFQDSVLNHHAKYNAGDMGDARKWAANVGDKVKQVTASLLSMPLHVVILLHSQLEKNELSGAIIEEPKIFSKLRDNYGTLFSSFFYATKQGGKPVVWTTDQGFVRGLGTRGTLPPVSPPDFTSLYGKEITK